jgi:hypothetical protein
MAKSKLTSHQRGSIVVVSQQAPAWPAFAAVRTAFPALTEALPEQRSAAVFVGNVVGSARAGLSAEAEKKIKKRQMKDIRDLSGN